VVALPLAIAFAIGVAQVKDFLGLAIAKPPASRESAWGFCLLA